MASERATRPQPSLMNRLSRSGWLNMSFLLPYFVFFFIFLAIPILYGLWVSLFRYELVSPDPPEFRGLGNYVEAMRDPLFWNGLWAAVRFVLLTVPARVVLALLIAFGISRLTRFESFFRAAFFLPTIVSVAVVSLVWQWFFNTDFGMFNHYLGRIGLKVMWLSEVRWAMKSISMMSVWWTFGSAMIIFLAGIKQIPRALYEAAEVDGAGTTQQFLHITLPLLKPVMLFTLVTSVIASFQVFGQTFIMTGGGPRHSTLVIVHYIYRQAFEYYRMGYGSALSYLLFAVIVAVTLIKFRVLGKDYAS
jgi:multiple sugar transport system permease protein